MNFDLGFRVLWSRKLQRYLKLFSPL